MNIYDLRISQATLKGFKEAIRKLQQDDLQIRRTQARAEGRRLELEPSEHEAEVMASQRQDYFSDWSKPEQERFKTEQQGMWSLIPVQFREKAERLARGSYD